LSIEGLCKHSLRSNVNKERKVRISMYLFEGDNRRGAIGASLIGGLEELIGAGGPAGGYSYSEPAFALGTVKPALAYIAAPPSATSEQMAAIAALPVADQEKMAAVNRAQVYSNIAKGLIEESNPDHVATALKDPEIQRLANDVPGFMDALKAHADGDQAALDQAKLTMSATTLAEIQAQPAYAANNTNFVATSLLPDLQAKGSPLAAPLAKSIQGKDTTAVNTATDAVQLIQRNGGAPLAVNPPMALPSAAQAAHTDTKPTPSTAAAVQRTASVISSIVPSGGGSGPSGGYGVAQIREAVESRNAGMVVDQQLCNKRRYPLGFVPTDVLTGQTLNIPAAPQNLFRPERLVIPSDIAFDFGVTDIKVGNTSQFVQNTEVPAVLFSEVAINTNVYFDSANIGNQVSVQVRNKSAGTLNFTAGLIGAIAK
jgi:hypothetical protein